MSRKNRDVLVSFAFLISLASSILFYLYICGFALNLLSGTIAFLTPIVDGCISGLDWLWSSFLSPIASWTGGVICDVLNSLADSLTTIGDWISTHTQIIEDLSIILGSFVIAWGVVTGAVTAWDVVCGISSVVTGAFAGATAFLTSPIGPLILAIGGAFKTVVNSIIGFAQNTINGFIRAINSAISLINFISGVNISKTTELNISRLAKGGLDTESVLANIGKGKDDEAILPLNDKVFEKLADGINKNNADKTQVISEESLYRAFLRALQDAPEKTATFITTLNNKIIAREVLREQQNGNRRLSPVTL